MLLIVLTVLVLQALFPYTYMAHSEFFHNGQSFSNEPIDCAVDQRSQPRQKNHTQLPAARRISYSQSPSFLPVARARSISFF
jgi:hypothetical protein